MPGSDPASMNHLPSSCRAPTRHPRVKERWTPDQVRSDKRRLDSRLRGNDGEGGRRAWKIPPHPAISPMGARGKTGFRGRPVCRQGRRAVKSGVTEKKLRNDGRRGRSRNHLRSDLGSCRSPNPLLKTLNTQGAVLTQRIEYPFR